MDAVNPIIIVAYCPDWADEFRALIRPLHAALGPLALRIDHIGSTAVPGLAAKDVLDMQVTVRDFTPDLEAAFGRAGYARQPYNQDRPAPHGDRPGSRLGEATVSPRPRHAPD